MLPAEVISTVPLVYEKGLNSGDLFFFPSTVHKHTEAGVEFEIRLCPALQRKPTLPTPHFEPDSAAAELTLERTVDQIVDPFEPPYNPNLFVGDLRTEEDEYVVLMNKYSVVPKHFLLVTKDFKSQTSPLMPSDLVAAYQLLFAASKAHINLFAFYNCGDLSGASQHHKHLQFVESEDDNGPPIEALARSVRVETPDKPFALSALPYANHVFRLPSRLGSQQPDQVEEVLLHAFLALLDLGISTIRHDASYPPGLPSYNVLLTLEHLHLIPRKQEKALLKQTRDELSVNAMGFAGLLLVKSETELDAVKEEGIPNILRSVGLKSVHDLQVAGTAAEADEPHVSTQT